MAEPDRTEVHVRNRKSSEGYIMPLPDLRKSLAVMEDLQAKHG